MQFQEEESQITNKPMKTLSELLAIRKMQIKMGTNHMLISSPKVKKDTKQNVVWSSCRNLWKEWKCGPTHMKGPEQANLQGGKAGQWLPRPGEVGRREVWGDS